MTVSVDPIGKQFTLETNGGIICVCVAIQDNGDPIVRVIEREAINESMGSEHTAWEFPCNWSDLSPA